MKDFYAWLEIFSRPSEVDRRHFPIIVENHTLFVNKHALAGHSAIFEEMLFGDFEPTEERLHLPGKSVGEMLEFFTVLTCVFDREKHPITVENFCPLWKMADEYDVVVSTCI